jgi:hypothetical protein
MESNRTAALRTLSSMLRHVKLVCAQCASCHIIQNRIASVEVMLLIFEEYCILSNTMLLNDYNHTPYPVLLCSAVIQSAFSHCAVKHHATCPTVLYLRWTLSCPTVLYLRWTLSCPTVLCKLCRASSLLDMERL